MNEQLSNKILERIDDDQIVPLPRWRFIFLRISFWLLAIVSLIVGSLAIGAMLFLFIDYHQHGLFAVPRDMSDFLLMTPFIWIIVFVLFIAVARISIKHTKKGYRYSLRKIVLVSILLSLIFGFILNFAGVGKTTHDFFNKVPMYNFFTHNSRNVWDRPVAGRLAGVILSVQGKNNFSIKDFMAARILPLVSSISASSVAMRFLVSRNSAWTLMVSIWASAAIVLGSL